MVIPTTACMNRGRCYVCPQKALCSLSPFYVPQKINTVSNNTNTISNNTNTNTNTNINTNRISNFKVAEIQQDNLEALKKNLEVIEGKITKLLYQTEESKEKYEIINMKMDYIISGGKKVPEIRVTDYIIEDGVAFYTLTKDLETYNINGNFVLVFEKILPEEVKEVRLKYIGKEYLMAQSFIKERVECFLDGNSVGVVSNEPVVAESLAVYEEPILEEKKGLFGRKKWVKA